MEKTQHVLTDVKRFLYTVYEIPDRTSAEDKVLSSIIEALPWSAGGIFIRNVESTGLLYFTVKKGMFSSFPIQYSFKRDTLIGKALEEKHIIVVNTFDDIPPGVSFLAFLPYIDMGYKLAIVPLRPTNNPLYPHIAPGAIILARNDKDFAEEDILLIEEITDEYRNLLFLFWGALICQKRQEIITVSTDILKNSLSHTFHKTESLLNKYLRDVIDIIDGAERASILVRTPAGMKFLASHGYDRDVLMSIPPLPIENIKKWYHLSEAELFTGKPRIITDKEIAILGKVTGVGEKEKRTLDIKSNLAIPVVVDGKLVMLLNLDNFSSPVAFDDIDIKVATHMATYLASSYELITRQKRIDRQEILLAHLNLFAETLTDERYQLSIVKKAEGITTQVIFEQFQAIMQNAIQTFHPYIVKFAYTEEGPEVDKHIEDLPENIRDVISSIIDDVMALGYVLKSYKEYHILAVHKVFLFDNRKYHLYILTVKKNDVWMESDIRYILSAVNSALLFTKNLKYLSDIKEMQKETMLMLGRALEFRDMETKGHTERTAYYTRRLASALNFKDMEGIVWGAYLHDVGKIAIPDYILLKPGRLTREEFELMKKHVIYGYQLVKGIKGIPQTTLNVIRYHHEKWNGTGYLEGLKEKDIPLEARIFAVVDVFDALVSPRPYKEPWPVDKALKLIEKEKGKHFDPHVADAFIDLIQNKHMLEDYAATSGN